jgi:hypothetical protein
MIFLSAGLNGFTAKHPTIEMTWGETATKSAKV